MCVRLVLLNDVLV